MTNNPLSSRFLFTLTLLLTTATLAGCLDDLPDTAQVPGLDEDPTASVSSFDLGTSEDAQWVLLHLEEAPLQGVPFVNVTIEHRTTQNDTTTLKEAKHLCTTPLMKEGACQGEAGERWHLDVRIFTPCIGDVDEVHVLVDGDRIGNGPADACTHNDEEEATQGSNPEQADEDDTQEPGPEQAAATAKGVDLDGDGNVEWTQITLTSGENAPYQANDVSFSGTGPNGTSIDELCQSAQASQGTCENPFSAGDTWGVGENHWVPCQDAGNHLLTLSIKDTTILDTTVRCDEAP